MEDSVNLKKEIKEILRENSIWVRLAGRIGYTARGIVYLLIGVLAISGVVGIQKNYVGSSGALAQVVELPFGQLLLVIIIIGLICHTIWRFIQGFMDTDEKGSDAKAILIRTGYFFIGLVYLSLAFSTLKILLGIKGQSEFWAKSWTALILEQPFGQWVIAIIGILIIGIGLLQIFKAFSKKFQKNFLAEIENSAKTLGTHIARYGFTARGIVFVLIGGFFIFAAWNSNAGRTRDFGSALQFIEQQPYGVWLLLIIAIGLVAYGIFMLFLARYREMVSN